MWIRLIAVTLAHTTLTVGQTGLAVPGLTAHLQPVSPQIPLGRPVSVRFSIENTTDEPLTLIVPGTEPDIPAPESGLPLPHVFSGGPSQALSLTTASGRRWDRPSGLRLPKHAPILVVAAHSMVGLTLDLRDYYPVLRGAGQYRITWQPYAGAAGSATAVVTIAPLKQAQIVTDRGTLTVHFFYKDAPKHVANFLELAQSGFYNNKTFHRIVPGYIIQGGCPHGDGTGIRADGKRLAAEFNARAHQKGSISMALLDDDPNSASSQFFICNTDQPDWDGRFTVFGQLVGEESLATLGKIMAVDADDVGRPFQPVVIRSVRVLNEPTNAFSDTP